MMQSDPQDIFEAAQLHEGEQEIQEEHEETK